MPTIPAKTRRLVLSGLSIAISLSAASLVSGVAMAQQMVLEEVLVTARKREESLQDTPIAVSALGADTLQQLGMRDLSDLTKVVPNVDVYDGNGTSGAGNVFIRGVGARNTGSNYDSGVGIYVDGVYTGRSDGAILDNIDVQSVQVLRGPQGTLFGKNTTGGAILYTTNRPGEEFEGNAEVRLGNYDQQDVRLTLNVPLVDDTLLSRFTVYATTRDGHVKNKVDGSEFGDTDRSGAQAQLRWLPSEDLTLDLNYNHAETDQAPRGQNCEVVTGIPGTGWQSALQDAFIVIPSTGQSIAAHCQDNDDLGIDDVLSDLQPSHYRATTDSLSMQIEWQLNDSTTMKSTTAGRWTEAGQSDNLDAIAIPLLSRNNYGSPSAEERETEQLSQEFQISGSTLEGKLDYVAGVFAYFEQTDPDKASGPSGPFFGAIFRPTWAYFTGDLTSLQADNTSYSGFAQSDWHLNEQWTLTTGIRYTWEEREVQRDVFQPDVATLSTGAPAIYLFSNFYNFPGGASTYNPNYGFIDNGNPLNHQKVKIDNSDWTPMLSLQRSFEPAGIMDSGNAYFTVATGFLSGGISESVDSLTGLISEYDPEEVVNYELGFKMEGWDRRVRLNTALFYMDYSDRQLTSVRVNPQTGRISPVVINAKETSILGLEIETIMLPAPDLQITFNMTFNDGDIEEYEDERIVTTGSLPGADCTFVPNPGVDLCRIDRSDENLPRLPDQVYYLALQYTWHTDIGTITPMVQYSYRKGLDNCFDRGSCLSGLYVVDQEQLGARLTWFSPEENWRIAAYGNNLTDERYITGGTPLVDTTQTAGTIYNPPRMYGVEASYNF